MLMTKVWKEAWSPDKKNHIRYGALSSANLDFPEGMDVGSV